MGFIGVNAMLSAEQIDRVQRHMKENGLRFFSEGLREYIRHLEAAVCVSGEPGTRPGVGSSAEETALA